MSIYILPVIIVALVFYAIVKRVKVYDCFLDGGRESLGLVKGVFPYVATIYIAIVLFKVSGLSHHLATAL